MTDSEFAAHMEASSKLYEERAARGEVVFDGDPHWEAAMKGVADNAIAGAQKIIDARAAQTAHAA